MILPGERVVYSTKALARLRARRGTVVSVLGPTAKVRRDDEEEELIERQDLVRQGEREPCLFCSSPR